MTAKPHQAVLLPCTHCIGFCNALMPVLSQSLWCVCVYQEYFPAITIVTGYITVYSSPVLADRLLILVILLQLILTSYPGLYLGLPHPDEGLGIPHPDSGCGRPRYEVMQKEEAIKARTTTML